MNSAEDEWRKWLRCLNGTELHQYRLPPDPPEQRTHHLRAVSTALVWQDLVQLSEVYCSSSSSGTQCLSVGRELETSHGSSVLGEHREAGPILRAPQPHHPIDISRSDVPAVAREGTTCGPIALLPQGPYEPSGMCVPESQSCCIPSSGQYPRPVRREGDPVYVFTENTCIQDRASLDVIETDLIAFVTMGRNLFVITEPIGIVYGDREVQSIWRI